MQSQKYPFDTVIDRSNTNALTRDGFRDYLFNNATDIQFPVPDDELIPMWVADMGFAVAPEIISAIQDRLNNGILGYTMVFGDDYYNAFSTWTQRRYGWRCEQEHLKTSPGIIPALFELIEYVCRPDEKIIIFTPSYAFFKHAADHHNIELVYSKLVEKNGEFCIDFEDFEHKCADPKVTLCIFCHPHNPTGRTWSLDELKQVGEICSAHEVMILSDEIHCDVLRQGVSHIPLAKVFPDSKNIITCMAPSKTFNLAGMLFANIIISNDRVRQTWDKRHHIAENPLSIAAAQAAYTHGRNWLDQLTQYLDENFAYTREFLFSQLPEVRFCIPQATYFAWIDMGAYFPPSLNLTRYFAEHAGVLLEGGNMFVDNASGYIRLNLACPRSQLKQGLEKIAAACPDSTRS